MRIQTIMMFVASSSLLVGCAAGGVTAAREVASPPRQTAAASVNPAGTGGDAFLRPDNPQLPTAERSSARIHARTGALASADIELCVTGDGHVHGASLVRSSLSRTYDRAVLHDAERWEFPGSADPSDLVTCETATVTYHPQP